MKLLFDIGNSRIKSAQYSGGTFTDHVAAFYTHNDVCTRLNQLHLNTPVPDDIWISNVAGDEMASQLRQWCISHWNIQAHFAQVTETCAGVKNAYAETTRLGIDRWLALIGAHARYKEDALIADCGTAVTLDVMNKAGEHLGGLIVPGTTLMRESLARTTAAISISSHTPASAALAAETEQAVTNGCHMAVAVLIERVWRDQQHLDNMPQCLVTGGDATVVGKLLTIPYSIEPHLVLEGLAIVAGQQT